MEEKKLNSLLEVFLTIHQTKEYPRQGFYSQGFKLNEADSVAAHAFVVTGLSYFLVKQLNYDGWKLDENKVLKMALMHDMGESITGDIGRLVKIFAGGKLQEIEEQAFQALTKNLDFKKELLEIHKEYEERESLESILVKGCDFLDAITQAVSVPGSDIDSFRKEADFFLQEYKKKNAELGKVIEEATKKIFNKEVKSYRGHREDSMK